MRNTLRNAHLFFTKNHDVLGVVYHRDVYLLLHIFLLNVQPSAHWPITIYIPLK